MRSIAAGVLGLGLVGCTIATSASDTASSTVTSASTAPAVAAVAGATVLVTVPELAPLSTGSGSPAGPVSRTGVPGNGPPVDRSPTAGTPTANVPVATSAPSPAPDTARSPRSTAQATTSSTSSSSIVATSAPATLTVQLANCPTCTVLATHAGVTSTLAAALVATGPGRAALLALRADGSVAGVGNVVYGTTFPSPPGGQLACDSGRCIVIARQNDGTAIASAYQVSAGGVWSEVTGQPGIASVTDKARTLPVGGGVGVAVQDETDGSAVWIVYVWEGDGYGVKGCTAAATPDPDALAMDACLS